MSSDQLLPLDGVSTEGVGLIPDIKSLTKGVDVQFERAIRYIETGE